MARERRFVPYVDIPLQHVSRAVLSPMRRGGDPASYRAMIARMRARVPDIAIRTTFIVGFPTEGEAEFGELVEFVREAEFDNLGAFTYSPEPGSGSEPLGDPVPVEEKERRRDFLLSLQRPIARRKARALRGRTLEAIVEGPCEETEHLLEGRLRSQAPEIDGRLLINDTGERTVKPGRASSPERGQAPGGRRQPCRAAAGRCRNLSEHRHRRDDLHAAGQGRPADRADGGPPPRAAGLVRR